MPTSNVGIVPPSITYSMPVIAAARGGDKGAIRVATWAVFAVDRAQRHSVQA